jgi:hypothetical protein
MVHSRDYSMWNSWTAKATIATPVSLEWDRQNPDGAWSRPILAIVDLNRGSGVWEIYSLPLPP